MISIDIIFQWLKYGEEHHRGQRCTPRYVPAASSHLKIVGANAIRVVTELPSRCPQCGEHLNVKAEKFDIQPRRGIKR